MKSMRKKPPLPGKKKRKKRIAIGVGLKIKKKDERVIKEKFTRNAIFLNNMADLSRYISTMTGRCIELKDKKDLFYYKSMQTHLITILNSMDACRRKS